VLPLWQTSDAAATLLSLTATHPAAGGASFTNASSNPTLNATNSTGATAINADGTVRINGAAGQAALVVTSGRTVLAAGTVANGAEIAADLTVVSVDDDGIVGGIPSVMLPTAVENGTVMMVSTEDADGALVDGWPIDVLTSRTFVRVNGTWKPNW
jgi:hypothetical protein